tara:strand:+ start:1090 stop:1476 length:387 start_codon:yes stop_codon:yes gene_type:complete
MNNIMNPFEKIPPNEIQFLKEKVQRWVTVDKQISELEGKVKELKKIRNKELEPEITGFMNKHNVADLNTEIGKIRCKEKKVKQGLNKDNIRENLSKYLDEENKLDSAINDLWTNRKITVTYQLQKVKK